MKKKALSVVLLLVFCLVLGIGASTPAMAATRKLNTPRITSITFPSVSSAKLKWSKVRGAKQYQLYVSFNGGKYKKLATTRSNTYTHKNLKVKVGNRYSYKVRAIRGRQRSSFSSVQTIVCRRK